MRFATGVEAVRAGWVGLGLGLAACGGGAGTTASPTPGPSPPAGPPPIAVVVSFGAASAEVFEGDTVEIPIRYESRSLGSPWRLSITPVPGTAAAADFSIPENFVDIPAGSGTTGEVVFRLVGLPDANFDEGSETLTLRFVPDPAVNAQIGDELPVVIQEGGALVSFAEEEVAVAEGTTVDISVRYEVRNLTAAVDLSVSPLLVTLAENDLLLEDATFEIPAGRGLVGNALLRLTPRADDLFAEADETASLHLVPPEPEIVSVRLGTDLRLVVRESGVSPCPGVRLRAQPPAHSGSYGPNPYSGLFSTFTVELDESAKGVSFVLRGPYLAEAPESIGFDLFHIAEWRRETTGGAVRHELDIGWPADRNYEKEDFEFGFLGGPCSGASRAVCRNSTSFTSAESAECELRP